MNLTSLDSLGSCESIYVAYASTEWLVLHSNLGSWGHMISRFSVYRNEATQNVVSSPGRDSHDLRSSRLAEATQKVLGTIAL